MRRHPDTVSLFLPLAPLAFWDFSPLRWGGGKPTARAFRSIPSLFLWLSLHWSFELSSRAAKNLSAFVFLYFVVSKNYFHGACSHSFPSIPSAYVCIKYAAKIIKIHTHIYIYIRKIWTAYLFAFARVCVTVSQLGFYYFSFLVVFLSPWKLFARNKFVLHARLLTFSLCIFNHF